MSVQHYMTEVKRIKTAQLNLRISPALKAAAEKAAAAEHRTLTSYIEKLILDDQARNAAQKSKKGYLK
jgi:hypothetical protein